MTTREKSFIEIAKGYEEKLIAWRRHLHQYPELSFQEVETANFIISILEKLDNVTIEKNIGGGNGIVATLSSGTGPTFALRADMDALPIQEENTFSFASKNKGVMHACGHDAHVAMLLGAVHILAEEFSKGAITGTVKCIFQPAEEAADEDGLTGAPYMIREGVLDDVESIVALHVCPWQPVGTIQMNDGYSMANVDNFKAKIYAKGGHGGYPHMGTDPVWILGAILQAFYGVVGRRISPLDTAVASIGEITLGTANNIMPNEIQIGGTLRTYTPEIREKLALEIEKVFLLAETFGGEYEFHLEKGEPALNNDKRINQLIESVVRDTGVTIHWEPFGLGGEDFGHMTEKIPGALFFLGCALEDGEERDLHTPNFTIDERCLPIGAAILAETARRFLTARAKGEL
ncbi:M20 metallopeptidase family protein [Ornithinibacillus halophilus]|uniref:M20 metallopeptidase family protein n=1 Tax=Ornithinibacillus halophilus TaxID=930117 RepID=UPI000932430F|nr:amidohydrolase [Ornithinibacillus halophilus]